MASLSDRILTRCAEFGIFPDGLAYQVDTSPEILINYLLAPDTVPEGFWERVSTALDSALNLGRETDDAIPDGYGECGHLDS